MRREVVVLNPTATEKEIVNGMNVNVNLKGFRDQLNEKGYTEINTYLKDGKRLVEFITEKLTRIQLIDAGLIRGTKEERQAYKEATKTVIAKKSNFGYAW